MRQSSGEWRRLLNIVAISLPDSRMHCIWETSMIEYRYSRKSIFVSAGTTLIAAMANTFAIDPLAYMTAKSHGLTEECEAILEATGLTEEQITLPTIGTPLS